MKIQGRYTSDDNFTRIYSDNTVYVIANGNGNWGSRKVGDHTGYGILTQETYDKWASECDREGVFELEEA